MPSGCARAAAVTSARVSHGKTGSDADLSERRVTSDDGAGRSVLTLRRHVLDHLRVVVGLTDLGRASG